MAYSERPNVNFMRTERKPEEGARTVTPFVRDLVGDDYDPGERIGLVAIEPEHDPTNTSAYGKLVVYMASDAGGHGAPEVFVNRYEGLPTNSVYAAKPMGEIYNELESRGANVYVVTPIEFLGHRELGKAGGVNREDPASYEKLRNNLKHEFENGTGLPSGIAFIVEGVTTVGELRAGTINFSPLPARIAQNFREGWRYAGLLSRPGRASPVTVN